jgi:hypothetical protein
MHGVVIPCTKSTFLPASGPHSYTLAVPYYPAGKSARPKRQKKEAKEAETQERRTLRSDSNEIEIKRLSKHTGLSTSLPPGKTSGGYGNACLWAGDSRGSTVTLGLSSIFLWFGLRRRPSRRASRNTAKSASVVATLTPTRTLRLALSAAVAPTSRDRYPYSCSEPIV